MLEPPKLPPRHTPDLDHLETLKSFYELLELANSSKPYPEPVTAEEISTIIQALPLRKAAGPDQLVNEHLLYAGPILPSILATIFNSILLSGHVPSAFRHGLIIPIPKGPNKDLSVPSNYRGTTLLSTIS